MPDGREYLEKLLDLTSDEFEEKYGVMSDWQCAIFVGLVVVCLFAVGIAVAGG